MYNLGVIWLYEMKLPTSHWHEHTASPRPKGLTNLVGCLQVIIQSFTHSLIPLASHTLPAILENCLSEFPNAREEHCCLYVRTYMYACCMYCWFVWNCCFWSKQTFSSSLQGSIHWEGFVQCLLQIHMLPCLMFSAVILCKQTPINCSNIWKYGRTFNVGMGRVQIYIFFVLSYASFSFQKSSFCCTKPLFFF